MNYHNIVLYRTALLHFVWMVRSFGYHWINICPTILLIEYRKRVLNWW